MKTSTTKNLMEWIVQVNKVREEYWNKSFNYREYTPLKFTKGSKFVKIMDVNCIWGFVCMFDGEFKGAAVKKGDLMKPASLKAPAKHARGNIFNGVEFDYYGPKIQNMNYTALKDSDSWTESIIGIIFSQA